MGSGRGLVVVRQKWWSRPSQAVGGGLGLAALLLHGPSVWQCCVSHWQSLAAWASEWAGICDNFRRAVCRRCEERCVAMGSGGRGVAEFVACLELEKSSLIVADDRERGGV